MVAATWAAARGCTDASSARGMRAAEDGVDAFVDFGAGRRCLAIYAARILTIALEAAGKVTERLGLVKRAAPKNAPDLTLFGHKTDFLAPSRIS